jgi:hypothetical protein
VPLFSAHSFDIMASAICTSQGTFETLASAEYGEWKAVSFVLRNIKPPIRLTPGIHKNHFLWPRVLSNGPAPKQMCQTHPMQSYVSVEAAMRQFVSHPAY